MIYAAGFFVAYALEPILAKVEWRLANGEHCCSVVDLEMSP
jgi:hypothetical protein